MLTRQERKEIRRRIEKAAQAAHEAKTSTGVFGAWGNVALRDAPCLLDALDKADDEIDHLRRLVGKLFKIVNLASLTECDHRCLTKETQGELFHLIAEAKTVLEHE
ncbi:MAG: hypothetical protein ACE5H7_04315 [Acidiferrobacterales bacterium]